MEPMILDGTLLMVIEDLRVFLLVPLFGRPTEGSTIMNSLFLLIVDDSSDALIE